MNKTRWTIIVLILSLESACSQQSPSKNSTNPVAQHVGGGCDGCEAIYSTPVPFDQMNWVDTLPDFHEAGPKMVISGKIYQSDGKTPAAGVILYVYHTDQTGHYTPRQGQTGAARRNGYIRGWMKTNSLGEYKFFTLRPAPYPGHQIPSHIHPIIKEPDMNEYYIDEYLFNGDPFLTTEERNKQEGRGGSGIISLENQGGILVGHRDIYLGRKIPNYPNKKEATLQSASSSGDVYFVFESFDLILTD
jgi:protocatechuate 3,4-dioxygenase, beta subunit